MTALILLVTLVLGVVAYRSYAISRSSRDRRKTFAWAWAFWGAVAGSFFGIAGFGPAIAGTGVGALLGYLGASAWMKIDRNDDPPKSSEAANPPQRQAEAAKHAVAPIPTPRRWGIWDTLGLILLVIWLWWRLKN